LCRKPKGCEIKELAGDKEITRICNAFLEYKALDLYGHKELGLKILKKAKVNDGDLIVKLEVIFAGYMDYKRKQKPHNSKYAPE